MDGTEYKVVMYGWNRILSGYVWMVSLTEF